MYTLDTNAIIYFLKDDPSAVRIIKRALDQTAVLYISAITEIELFSFSKMSSNESGRIENILQTIAVMPVDSRIARIAGSLRREYNLAIADSAIAATALFTGTTLLTRNIKHFHKVANLASKRI